VLARPEVQPRFEFGEALAVGALDCQGGVLDAVVGGDVECQFPALALGNPEALGAATECHRCRVQVAALHHPGQVGFGVVVGHAGGRHRVDAPDVGAPTPLVGGQAHVQLAGKPPPVERVEGR
jgi:hypothetical protein